MTIPFPTFCQFEDGQEHLSLDHVGQPQVGHRCYTLPVGVLPQHSEKDLLQLEAALNETQAHVVTLQTQLWVRTVVRRWETDFSGIEALRMNRVDDTKGDQEWRFAFWYKGERFECNQRGYTQRPPWKDINPPPADRYRREAKNVEDATKILRDLLVDFPKDPMATFLMDAVFETPANAPAGVGLSKDEWRRLVFSTTPTSVLPESRAMWLEGGLPGDTPRTTAVRF